MRTTHFSLRLESPNGFESLAYPETFCDFNFLATFAALRKEMAQRQKNKHKLVKD